jgi:poly-gamma-glutamate synthesis protein (capsule biosynthesis protein)
MKRRTFLRGLAAGAAIALARPVAAGVAAEGLPGPAPPDSTAAPPDPAGAPPDSAAARPPEIALVAAGDVVLGYNLQDHFDRLLAEGEPRDALLARYFSGVRELFETADLAVVNLECPFTERGTKVEKNFNFRARPELVEILARGSVDVVTCANNHVKDYGPEGIDDTLATLDGAGIAHFGAGRTLAAARAPRIVERGGVRVGFVGWYFQIAEDMFEPKVLYATRWTPGVAGCHVDLDCIRAMVREDVERLVPQVDVAIPFFHWGKEGVYLIREYQVELAHLCVDLGAKAVLGAHPHRFQGVEVYRGAPIVYSLGNFVYGGIKDPRDTLSGVVRLTVSRQGVARAEVVPVRYTRWPDDPFRPVPLEGDEAAAAIAFLSEQSSGFAETLPMLANGVGGR